MRTITLVLFAILIAFAPFANAQVTNLTIQGSSTSFTFVSGGTLSWEYNLPAGDTAYVEIWIDVNLNSAIDPATDRLYMGFLQGDGITNGLNGPPDVDGAVNGHAAFSGNVGIAPGTFVMRFTDHGTGLQVPGTCTALASPAHTISGKVTVPAGKSAQYILVEASREGYENSFWHALTNPNGDYVIQIDADTAGSPWHVGISNNPFPASVTSPEEAWVYPGLNPAGIDFSISLPAAKVVGLVVDEFGHPLPDWQVFLQRGDQGVNRNHNTDLNGYYELGAMLGELNGQSWFIQTGAEDPMSSTTMMAQRQLQVLQNGDSLYRRLTIYSVNSSIQGQLKIDGSAPPFPVQIAAWSSDTAQIFGQAEAGTGNFGIGVSNKIYNYTLFAINMGSGFNGQQVTAHPGDTGVQLNLTTTSLETTAPVVPERFALEQNYPNPFNPTTGIRYQVPGVSSVKLTVFNILGQEVATLVNEVKQPGIYTVQFDASRLPSGFYFYRMTAADFTSTKSMVILK
ncbi:T9SS C-terminal target domain-containing protein [bacterium]|nr:MAG: T9SS C-terminal target domain-containing protein [bacterium]